MIDVRTKLKCLTFLSIKQDWSAAVGLMIMSKRELNSIEVLSQVTRGAMTAVTAANVLGLASFEFQPSVLRRPFGT
ncbi:hypothetical protein [Paracoccus seriniphilus]|uniref:hypothetical protein n=1 Tax=Paracoccus seriniphilus TaxID=184748 RepID=UPI002350E78D|nr:hypothetical protein [Paracoccus seriniphilus]